MKYEKKFLYYYKIMDNTHLEIEKIENAINHFANSDSSELFNFLNEDDEAITQIALLKIDKINNEKEAEKIASFLTNHSSETREYTAFLINRLMKIEEINTLFSTDFILEQFAKSISDVNPKVCRKIMEILPLYKRQKELHDILLPKSFEYIKELQEKNKNKNYQYNTKSFHLYWHIFAIGYIMNNDFILKNKNKYIKLLNNLFNFDEYTIREKAAYLAQKIYNINKIPEIKDIIKKNENDENFFVKEVLN